MWVLSMTGRVSNVLPLAVISTIFWHPSSAIQVFE
jgi:hypothetical protein